MQAVVLIGRAGVGRDCAYTLSNSMTPLRRITRRFTTVRCETSFQRHVRSMSMGSQKWRPRGCLAAWHLRQNCCDTRLKVLYSFAMTMPMLGVLPVGSLAVYILTKGDGRLQTMVVRRGIRAKFLGQTRCPRLDSTVEESQKAEDSTLKIIFTHHSRGR